MSSLPSEAVVELCVDLQVPLLQPKWGAAALKGVYKLMYYMNLHDMYFMYLYLYGIMMMYYDDVL